MDSFFLTSDTSEMQVDNQTSERGTCNNQKIKQSATIRLWCVFVKFFVIQKQFPQKVFAKQRMKLQGSQTVGLGMQAEKGLVGIGIGWCCGGRGGRG